LFVVSVQISIWPHADVESRNVIVRNPLMSIEFSERIIKEGESCVKEKDIPEIFELFECSSIDWFSR